MSEHKKRTEYCNHQMREQHICDGCFFNFEDSCHILEIRQKTDHGCDVCGGSEECYYFNQKKVK